MKCLDFFMEETHVVLTSSHWIRLAPARLIQILRRLHVSTVPEIAIFRAVVEWADNQCRLQGISVTGENRRRVLTEKIIKLIRFPAMQNREVQWEVLHTGVLQHQDISMLHTMQHHKQLHGELPESSTWEVEERDMPLKDHFHRKNNSQEHLMERLNRTSHVYPGINTYNPEADDELDALLGAKLLRKHMDKVALQASADAGTLSQTRATDSQRMLVFSGGRSLKPKPLLSISNQKPHAPVEQSRQESLDLPGNSVRNGNGARKTGVSLGVLKELHGWGGTHVDEPGLSLSSQPLLRAEPLPAVEAPASARTNRAFSLTARRPEGAEERPGTVGPSDFSRLSAGVYRFRGRTVGVAVRDGEAVVYDRECAEPMNLPGFSVARAQPVGCARPLPAVQPLRGAVPLDAFLRRRPVDAIK